jgi:hypothetical protein
VDNFQELLAATQRSDASSTHRFCGRGINLLDPLGLEEINYTNSDGSIDYWRFAKDLAGETGKQFKADCVDPEKNRDAAAAAIASGTGGVLIGRAFTGARGAAQELAKRKAAQEVAKRQAQRGIRNLEKRMAEHMKKLEEFRKNPTVRPGMEKLPRSEIEQQHLRRIKHLEDEIRAFQKGINDLKASCGIK